MSVRKPRPPFHLLLVEDEFADAELFTELISELSGNIHVHHVSNGQEALDYLAGRGKWEGRDIFELPAVTLLELKLPFVSRQIRSEPRTRRMPVVILTTSNDQEDVSAGYDPGVNSYIRKPVDFHQFEAAARNLGLYWLLLNETPPRVPGAEC